MTGEAKGVKKPKPSPKPVPAPKPFPIDPDLLDDVKKKYLLATEKGLKYLSLGGLTPRELEVLRLLWMGRTDREIAEEFDIGHAGEDDALDARVIDLMFKLIEEGLAIADRYAGCLLGLACGDALGGPVEFVSRDEIARAYPHGVRDFVGGGWLHLAPGEVTDDTQMTLALARGLRQPDPVDLGRVATEFLVWYSGNPKDVGYTTRAALALLAAGTPWPEAGERVLESAGGSRSAGNGTVMRCAPVALRFRRDPAALVAYSIDTARITHADSRCTWGAVAVNQAIVHLLNGGGIQGSLNAAVAGVENQKVRDAVREAAEVARDQLKSGGYVLDTIRAAFWALLNHDSCEEAIVAAVSLGGDADTTGAVAGALAGAAYGAGALPERWLRLLQPRAEIEELAHALLVLAENAGRES